MSYHDTTIGNRGGAYRQTNVDLEAAPGPNGGVGNLNWLSVR